MALRVFVTGGSGFVGAAVIEEILRRGHVVNALVNRRELKMGKGVESFKGGLFDEGALDRGLAGCDAAVHLVGIIREKRSEGVTFERMHVEGTKAVVEASKRAGVRRYVQMSALGTRADAEAEYHRTKWRAEEMVRASGLEWTIFRPSMIHGPGGEFMQMEAKWAKKTGAPWLFMPYFGGGVLGRGAGGKLQPVYVKDVARAFVDAVERRETIGKVYTLAGNDVLSWREMHEICAQAIVGHERWVMGIPAWYAKMVAAVTPGFLLPFNRDQVVMSQEDNVAEMEDFVRDFGWRPGGMRETLAAYAGEMREGRRETKRQKAI